MYIIEDICLNSQWNLRSRQSPEVCLARAGFQCWNVHHTDMDDFEFPLLSGTSMNGCKTNIARLDCRSFFWNSDLMGRLTPRTAGAWPGSQFHHSNPMEVGPKVEFPGSQHGPLRGIRIAQMMGSHFLECDSVTKCNQVCNWKIGSTDFVFKCF